MTRNDSGIDDVDLALTLRRLADAADVPPVDPRREAALLAAFDAAAIGRTPWRERDARRPYWGMAGLAAAAAILITVGLTPGRAGRHGTPSGGDLAMHKPLPSSGRGVQPDAAPPGEFVMLPGTAALPAMESGSLVRMDVPVFMLPALGVTPPAGTAAAVRADFVVGQDGLARAVRLVD